MSLKKFAAMAIVSSAAGLGVMGASSLAFAFTEPVPYAPFVLSTIQRQDRLADSHTTDIKNDQMKTVADTTKSKTYRVCEKSKKGFDGLPAIPARIVSGTGSKVVSPGKCADVHGQVLQVEPDGQMASDEQMVVHQKKAG